MVRTQLITALLTVTFCVTVMSVGTVHTFAQSLVHPTINPPAQPNWVKLLPLLEEADTVYLNKFLTDSLSDTPALRQLEQDFESFIKKWDIRGASLAIMRNDSLLFAKGFGWADKEAGIKMAPNNIMRIASVSKLITAIGIMVLQERGQLSLEDKVFGADGILDDEIFSNAIVDKRIYDITIEHLLRHQGGFVTVNGDPMFSTQNIIRRYHLDGPPDSKTLAKCVLSNRLGFAPGTGQTYSNFGYLLLSLVIEKVSGMDYEDFIQENVLHPARCFDMHIANNYYEDKYPNEVRYYMHAGVGLDEEYNLSGRMVPRCYGGRNIAGLLGAGAWCASPAELCRLVASIDGKRGVPDIISHDSFLEMTEYYDSETYSLGWNDTKPTGEWTRTGTLGGTSALIKCFPDGECWILVTNTSTYRGSRFTRYIAELFDKCREVYSLYLPKVNLFRGK